ncbi:LysR family transcriptional regulator [Rhizobium sp. TRM95796]|uniref:LysR family transcriptional regulator n=1 Tax=Rhizobium sp. TRM95796 TaxID=2979862 RepID=UPI00298800DF|nr:LysR family transcriptional regulator [Rhizobium sp. TRM95796]
MLGADWNDLDLFFHVATQGGLTGAAIATGVSAPTIGRRMLGLERQLGRTLFIRSPQGYRLAHDGAVLLDHVRVMRRAADSIVEWQRGAFALPIVSIAGDAWIAGFLADHAQAIRGQDDAFRICCKSAHTGLDLTFARRMWRSWPSDPITATSPSGRASRCATASMAPSR